ncbi:MAG: response regulator, partial [Mariprofundus sp.]|nr:response regulator [Mariprofundus sp.]
MKALIIDDDEGIRWVLDKVLREEGLTVLQAGSIAEAKTELANHDNINIVFLDVYLPDGNGMDFLATGAMQMPVVLLTAETTFGHAAEAYRIGAMEYLPKPFDLGEVRQLVQRVRPVQEPAMVKTKGQKDMIIGRSQAMQDMFRTLGRVATSDLTVLITGESGTG